MAAFFLVIARELFMLVLLGAIGAGPAAFLGDSVAAEVRFAFAPAVGLAVGSGIFTSLGWFVPATDTYWLVVPLAVASSGVAWGRWRRRRGTVSGVDRSRILVGFAQLAIIGLLVTGPLAIALASHDSVGPTSYEVADAAGYIASTDAMLHSNLQAQARAWSTTKWPWANLVDERADFYATGIQELDVTTFAADVDALLGYGATDTWDAFLLAFILTIALTVAGGIRYVLGRRTWAAVIGGALVGGAFFTQLFFDTSEGSICGLAMLVPLLVAGDRTVRSREVGPPIVLGILASGVIGLYPLFSTAVGGLFIGLVLALAWCLFRRRALPPSIVLERWPLRLAAFVVPALFLNTDASWRSYLYLKSVLLHPAQASTGLPTYPLNGAVVPAWLFQLRGLYQLTGAVNFGWVFLVVILPLLFAVAVVAGMRRYVLVLATLPLLLTAFASASYQRLANNCSYCEDRTLLPAVLFLLFAGVLGVVALNEATRGRRKQVVTSLAICVGAGLIYVAQQQYSLLSGNAYYLTDAVRRAISAIPPGRHTIELEGFNEGPVAYAEAALTYEAISEHNWGQLSVPDDYDENGSLDYFTPAVPLPGPQFHPGYDYVITRLGNIFNLRKTVETSGGVALEQRVHPLDVLVDYGETDTTVYRDPTGSTYLWQWSVPMTFIVTGSKTPVAYVGVRLELGAATSVTPGLGVVATKVQGNVLTACLRATGHEPALEAQLHLSGTLPPRLMAVRGSSSVCPYPLH